MKSLSEITKGADALLADLKQHVEDLKYLMETKATQAEAILEEIKSHKADQDKAASIVQQLEALV